MRIRGYRIVRNGSEGALQSSFGPRPSVGERGVLVRIVAASLNYRDLLVLRDTSGKNGLIPLSDGAGTVEAVGPAVTRWKPGDRVSPGFFPRWEHGAFRSAYLSHSLGGGQTDGVLSELIVADEASLVEIPEHLSFAEAAALPCAGVTAWHALFERAPLRPGDTVLVQGTGGVALIGLQLAAAGGARVIVTSSSDQKLERAKKYGAWKTINYREHPDWDKLVLELTDGDGADRILELGGPDTYDRSINAVAAGGRIAQIGVLTGFESRPNMSPLQYKNAIVDGICVGSVEHFEHLQKFITQHKIQPAVGDEFAYEEVESAFAHLKSGNHFGKVVVQVNQRT